MKASKCFWVALCLLVGSFSTELWAQKNLEAVVQKCKADKTIDKSIVTNKDPKTKKVYKIVSSFVVEGHAALQQEIKSAFERDKDEAYQVIENENDGVVSWFIRFSKGKNTVSYSINVDKEELFWTNHVVPQIPPAPNGCDCDTQQINQMYEVDNRDKTADLSALYGLLDKRQELSDQIEQMEQEKTAIEQQVKLQMQDAAYGTAPGYKVSWVSSESKRVDSQRLRKEQPDIFNQYSKNVSSRRFTIVHAA